MEIGHVIAKLRDEKKRESKRISLQNILNVGAITIALWEVNKRCPSLDTLVNIADFFFNVSWTSSFT